MIFQILRSGRIPHALMFTGSDGIGKQTAAMGMAMACNCEAYAMVGAHTDDQPETADGFPSYPCGCCSSCKKVAAGIHPDVTLIHPEGGGIKIAQIRSLCQVLSMKPFEGRMRVAILCDAHLMNSSSGNALLKTLEEPPEQTLLILTARQTSDLLPTIASRCQHIRFKPVSREDLSKALIQDHGFNAEEASTVATLAGGSFSRAISMKQSWLIWRKWLIGELGRLSFSPLHVVLALSEKLASQRDSLSAIFEIMLSWFRDLMVFSCNSSKVINRDQWESIREASLKYTDYTLIHSVIAVQAAQNHIESKTNIQLSMDHLLLLLRQYQMHKDKG